MAKKIKATRKLEGQTVALAGKFNWQNGHQDLYEKTIAAEGGTIVDGEKVEPNMVIEGNGVGGKPPGVIARIQKKFPAAQVMSPADFFKLTAPTADDFAALAHSKEAGAEAWNIFDQRLQRGNVNLSLSGLDLRQASLAHCRLQNCDLDEVDCRKADLTGASFQAIRSSKFDWATMPHCHLLLVDDCSLKAADLTGSYLHQGKFTACDFTGATLTSVFSSHANFRNCTFDQTRFDNARLEQNKFVDCTFLKADFSSANLAKADFSGCDLSGANFANADLREVDLTGARLNNASFINAVMHGAKLVNARLDGADFTGVRLANVDATGANTNKAKNFVLTSAVTAGPNMLHLATVVGPAQKFDAKIDRVLGKNEHVELNLGYGRYGNSSYCSTNYVHYLDGSSDGNYSTSTSLDQGMLDLAARWPGGAFNFDSLKVTAKGCSLGKAELKDLVLAAWCEAYGETAPTADELEQMKSRAANATEELRSAMLLELTGGSAGVKKWNNRSDRERASIGALKGLDLSGGKLAQIKLDHLSLEKTSFDKAVLDQASLQSASIKECSFVAAEMRKVSLAGAKASEANFDQAIITDANLRAANFKRATFRGATIRKVQFEYSDLCGVDFSNATMENVSFLNTKFDDKTILPPELGYPAGLDWKGPGLRPGSAPPVTIDLGTMDYDGFVTEIQNTIEAGRVANAKKMLRAERFQLFAEVKDDSVVGVVKSQTAADRVYACRLAADGSFTCGTQNLKPCGGLGGAVCKHLLVLLLGLTKASQLDAAKAATWLSASRNQKPLFDKDGMSETFLRYKGAEAGDIDWRPTETIPEDFM